MTAPRLSIGMPVYNAEPFLAAAIESLQQQTFADFELIISDNASGDTSLQIAERFAQSDGRIRILQQTHNIGANGNYRCVLDAARADLFKWASANDLCAPHFIERCISVLDARSDVVLACPRAVLFDTSPASGTACEHDFGLESEDRAQRFIDLFSQIHLNNPMNGIIRREPLMRALPMGSFRGADILLMVELALLGKYALVDEPLFFRQMSPAAATSRRGLVEADNHLVPGVTRPLLWQHWRYQLRLLHIVARAMPYDKSWLRVMQHALRRVSWARRELAIDVQDAFNRAVNR